MVTAAEEHQLDNPIYFALVGRQRHLAAADAPAPPVGGDLAAGAANGGSPTWFDPEVNIWHGAPELDADGWEDMATAVGAAGGASQVVVVMRRDLAEPEESRWRILGRRLLFQLVAAEPIEVPVADAAVVELGVGDVEDMLALTTLTEPGPFARRTIEMGRYVGIRDQGRLVAMAGERSKLSSATEVSAVCTHPDHVGRGFGGLLTATIAAGIAERGETAFLHLDHQNERALRLYEYLGFARRAESQVIAAKLSS